MINTISWNVISCMDETLFLAFYFVLSRDATYTEFPEQTCIGTYV